MKQIIKNVVPINTCSPWNPVAKKKVDPYDESEILKGASKYSYTCNIEKYTPKIIVISKLEKNWL